MTVLLIPYLQYFHLKKRGGGYILLVTEFQALKISEFKVQH